MKLPAGTTTISGQPGHSLKLSLGLSARSSRPESGLVARVGANSPAGSTIFFSFSLSGGGTTRASCCLLSASIRSSARRS